MDIKAKSITLKNGNTHELRSVNIFIGPNNSGKSSLLRELKEHTERPALLESILFHYNDEMQFLKSIMDETGDYNVKTKENHSWSANDWKSAKSLLNQRSGSLPRIIEITAGKIYRRNSILLNGKQRLEILGDQQYDGVSTPPNNVYSKLHLNADLKEALREHVLKVFPDSFFCIWYPNQGKLSGFLSTVKPENDIEYFDSHSAIKFFNDHARPIDEYSDGVNAYIGILVSIIAEDQPTFFIDEPEAFLHPSLCYELGKTITEICKGSSRTCFIATHSPQFIKGCLSSHPESNTIIRLDYLNKVSTSHALTSKDTLSMIQNPLLSSLGVAEALFHSRVVIVEGDSDRAFYSEINNRLLREDKGGIPNCLFINAQNKQTIANIVSLLRSMNVACAAITDIDVFKDGGSVYAKVTSALKTPTGVFENLRTKVDRSLKEALAGASTSVTMDDIQQIVNDVRDSKSGSPKNVVDKIKSKLKKRDYKKDGGISLLTGQEKKDAEYLINAHAERGWFIIPNGEVEIWLSSLGVKAKKEQWLSAIFERLGSDPDSNDYVKPPSELNDVWLFLKSINDWFESQ